MSKIKRACEIGYMYYSCLSAPVIIRIPKSPAAHLTAYTNNNTAESNIKAVCDSRWFNQLVQDAVVEMKRGKEYFCYDTKQITAIKILMPEYQIEILNDDGIYRLYAHRGN
jgi:hypothetical protein